MSHDTDSLITFWEDFTRIWEELGSEWQDPVSEEFEHRWIDNWDLLIREYGSLREQLGDFLNES